eukprot:5119-Chlamydomonas_euryale.AAC.5
MVTAEARGGGRGAASWQSGLGVSAATLTRGAASLRQWETDEPAPYATPRLGGDRTADSAAPIVQSDVGGRCDDRAVSSDNASSGAPLGVLVIRARPPSPPPEVRTQPPRIKTAAAPESSRVAALPPWAATLVN